MCGICGLINPREGVEPALLDEMVDTLQHRGPDARGTWVEGDVGLGHRRLSILDLHERGRQPMADSNARFLIVYNGEVYNFRSLRARLEQRGHIFRTETDTEVLLAMYEEFGEEMLFQLNGMFAFAIWDRTRRVLFAARDRLGIKPFYYAQVGDGLVFGSEQKAILRAGVSKELDSARFTELLYFRYIAGEPTLYRAIKKLLPGHSLRWTEHNLSIRRWWDLSERIRELDEEGPLRAPHEWFRGTFDDAVEARTMSDVPVGVLLSGGLDSSSVVASLGQTLARGMATFTVGFAESEYDEAALARAVAERFGFDFHQIRVEGDSLYQSIQDAAWLHDEPLVHQNDAQMLAISRYAKEHVSVLLSGEGGDELLGGYIRYKPLRFARVLEHVPVRFLRLLMAVGNDRVAKLARYLTQGELRRLVLFNSANLYPADLNDDATRVEEAVSERIRILAEAESVYSGNLPRIAMYADLHTHLCSLLDRNDRMTMGAGIECRVPFLDHRIVEGSMRLPSELLLRGKKGKRLLVESVGYRLPPEVLSFKKLGFSVPWSRHLREGPGFVQALHDMPKSDVFQAEAFQKIDVRSVIERFRQGSRFDEILLRQLMMVHIWHQAYYQRF